MSALYTTNDGIFRIYALKKEWEIEVEKKFWSREGGKFGGTEGNLVISSTDPPTKIYPWKFEHGAGYYCQEPMSVEIHELEAEILKVEQGYPSDARSVTYTITYVKVVEEGEKIILSSEGGPSVDWKGPSTVLLGKDGTLFFLTPRVTGGHNYHFSEPWVELGESGHNRVSLQESGELVLKLPECINQQTGKLEKPTLTVKYRLLP